MTFGIWSLFRGVSSPRMSKDDLVLKIGGRVGVTKPTVFETTMDQ